MPRLFIAVWPNAATIAHLRSIERTKAPGVRWVPETNWHVTLRFLGDIDVDPVTTALQDAALPAATATLGPTVERLGRRLVVIPVAGLDDLARAVQDATAELGEPDERPFHGHVTLARIDPRRAPDAVGVPVDAAFDVDQIALVVSEPGPLGVEYRNVATFPAFSRGG